MKLAPPFLVALLLTTLLVSNSASALTDRTQLENWCSAGSVAAAGRCIGYLLAAEDALSIDAIEGVRACLPREIKLAEQHGLVRQWLQEHPRAESATALGLVARAYAQHYPCP